MANKDQEQPLYDVFGSSEVNSGQTGIGWSSQKIPSYWIPRKICNCIFVLIKLEYSTPFSTATHSDIKSLEGNKLRFQVTKTELKITDLDTTFGISGDDTIFSKPGHRSDGWAMSFLNSENRFEPRFYVRNQNWSSGTSRYDLGSVIVGRNEKISVVELSWTYFLGNFCFVVVKSQFTLKPESSSSSSNSN